VYSTVVAIAKKKWWADLNPIRKRWIWAIRRVILQKVVAEVTLVLARYEAKHKREREREIQGVGSESKESESKEA
jgi:hypothetical protein